MHSADTVLTAVWSELNLCWLKLKKVTRVEKIAILFPWKREGEERKQNGLQGFSKGCPHLAADLTLSSLKSALLAANLCNLAARSLIPIKTYLWLWANQLSAYRVSRNRRPKVGWFCFMATSDCEIHTTYEMSHFLGTFILLISIHSGSSHWSLEGCLRVGVLKREAKYFNFRSRIQLDQPRNPGQPWA